MAAALPVGRLAGRIALVAAYVLPAAIMWMVLGLVVNLLPLSLAALILMAVYGTFYGLAEITGRPRPAAPGTRWQVPSAWVRNTPKWRRTLVWGSVLGPGFATRNPYAGFALLPLAVAAVGEVWSGVMLAAAIGIAHSTGRALALLRDVRHAHTADYLQSVLKSVYWRMFDGFALLVVSGIAAVICSYRL